METSEYLDILKEQVEKGKEASMIISGNSMAPFLYHGRDVIYFSKPKGELRRGDMAFFQRDTGQYVMHRIVRVTGEGLYFLGDNQTKIEGPVKREAVFAVVTRVKRKGRELDKRSFWWRFFRNIWINIVPLRHPIMKIYSFFNRVICGP